MDGASFTTPVSISGATSPAPRAMARIMPVMIPGMALGLAMLLGRFVPIVLVLGLAGSLAQRTRVPVSVGTLPTHGPLFVTLLVGVVLIVALLTFVPVLALSPIAEALS